MWLKRLGSNSKVMYNGLYLYATGVTSPSIISAAIFSASASDHVLESAYSDKGVGDAVTEEESVGQLLSVGISYI